MFIQGDVLAFVSLLIGTCLSAWCLSTASVGLAGASRIVAGRMLGMAPEMNQYAAFCRSSAFIIIGCIVPIVGWFAFGPILFFAATGAGVRAVLTRTSQSSMPAAEAA